MLDKKYYEGYEGEEQVKIWCEEGCEENGLLVWNGFFDTILEGCFKSEFQKGGIIECYYNHDGFYDGKWEMKYPHIVLDERLKLSLKYRDNFNFEFFPKTRLLNCDFSLRYKIAFLTVRKLILSSLLKFKELKTFDEDVLDAKNQGITKIAKEIIGQLISFIDAAISKNAKVYIEYE